MDNLWILLIYPLVIYKTVWFRIIYSWFTYETWYLLSGQRSTYCELENGHFVCWSVLWNGDFPKLCKRLPECKYAINGITRMEIMWYPIPVFWKVNPVLTVGYAVGYANCVLYHYQYISMILHLIIPLYVFRVIIQLDPSYIWCFHWHLGKHSNCFIMFVDITHSKHILVRIHQACI